MTYKRHVALQKLPQHFGFLVEIVMRAVAVEELLQPLDAVGACVRVGSSQSKTPPASSSPGVSYRYSSVSVPSVIAASSTWRVVDGAFLTSPNPLSRNRVRRSEVFAGIGVPDNGE